MDPWGQTGVRKRGNDADVASLLIVFTARRQEGGTYGARMRVFQQCTRVVLSPPAFSMQTRYEATSALDVRRVRT